MKLKFEEGISFGLSVGACTLSAWINHNFYLPIILWTLVMIFQRMPDKLQKAEVDVKDGKIELEEESK